MKGISVFLLFVSSFCWSQNDQEYIDLTAEDFVRIEVSDRKGCVINSVNRMDFKLYDDSTQVSFNVHTDLHRGYYSDEELMVITIPFNLLDSIKNLERTFENKRIETLKGKNTNFDYMIEFMGGKVLGGEGYKLEKDEYQVLANWFEELKTISIR
jgi:hypothetical protein